MSDREQTKLAFEELSLSIGAACEKLRNNGPHAAADVIADLGALRCGVEIMRDGVDKALETAGDVDPIELLAGLGEGLMHVVVPLGDKVEAHAERAAVAIRDFVQVLREEREQQAAHDRVLGKVVELNRGVG